MYLHDGQIIEIYTGCSKSRFPKIILAPSHHTALLAVSFCWLMALNKAVFPCNGSTISVKLLIGHPAIFYNVLIEKFDLQVKLYETQAYE
jgi:hypothetical protein